MKKNQTLIILLLIIAASCKKTENTNPAANAANSLAVNTSGLDANFNSMAANAPIYVNQACGSTVSDSTTISGSSNGVTYSYFLRYTHTLFCNQNHEPDNITYHLTYHGSSDGPNLSSLDTGTSVFKIGGLTPRSMNYVISGEYKRTGKFISKGPATFPSGTSAVDVVATNFMISKTNSVVMSGGSITMTIFLTSPRRSGEIFGPYINGDGIATLGGSGYSCTANLVTGLISNP